MQLRIYSLDVNFLHFGVPFFLGGKEKNLVVAILQQGFSTRSPAKRAQYGAEMMYGKNSYRQMLVSCS